MIATKDLEAGDVVLVSEAYVSIILSSHKKRVCTFCHQDFRRRLSLCCGEREVQGACEGPPCRLKQLPTCPGPAFLQSPWLPL